MAKTYFEQLLTNLGVVEEGLTDEQRDYYEKIVRASGHEPSDIFDDSNYGEEFTCSICGKEIKGEFSNNAQPVNDGRCCSYCNANVVIPARIKELGAK